MDCAMREMTLAGIAGLTGYWLVGLAEWVPYSLVSVRTSECMVWISTKLLLFQYCFGIVVHFFSILYFCVVVHFIRHLIHCDECQSCRQTPRFLSDERTNINRCMVFNISVTWNRTATQKSGGLFTMQCAKTPGGVVTYSVKLTETLKYLGHWTAQVFFVCFRNTRIKSSIV